MIALLTCTALAGDLTVTTPWPAVVLVDGVVRPYVPGTLTVTVNHLVGDHRVEVMNAAGQSYGAALVTVPSVGLAPVVFDGQAYFTQGAAPAPAPAPEPAAPVAMDEAAFARLLAAAQQAHTSDQQTSVVVAAAARNWFTVDQVKRLLRVMFVSSGQLAVAKACAPRVVDPENAYTLAQAFFVSSHGQEALSYFE